MTQKEILTKQIDDLIAEIANWKWDYPGNTKRNKLENLRSKTLSLYLKSLDLLREESYENSSGV